MKKKLALFLAIVLSLSICLAGCGQKKEEAPAPSTSTESSGTQTEAPAEKYGDGQMLTIMSGNVGGQLYSMNTAMATVWNEELDVTVRLAPGSGTQTLKSMATGEVDFGMCQMVPALDAEKGIGNFADVGPIDDMRVMLPTLPVTIQGLLPKDSDITGLADLEGKRVGFSSVGSLVNTFLFDILENMYGITPDSIVAAGGTVNYLADGDIVTAMQDEQVDCAFFIGSVPRPEFVELENRPGVKVFPFADEELQYMLDKNDRYIKTEIPAGTYGDPDAHYTVQTCSCLFVRDAVDEELVYQMTKTFWENLDTAKAASIHIEQYTTLDYAQKWFGIGEYHPGAIRYYEEIGLWG